MDLLDAARVDGMTDDVSDLSEAAAPQAELSTEARLPLESEERSRVEYLLQMSLQGQARRAKIRDIVAISNPHLSLRFQKRTHVRRIVSPLKLQTNSSKGFVIALGHS